jgi:vitamin-K-epoxide reductase (warfarin-sensitive)
MLTVLLTLAIIGFAVSAYGYITEQKVKKNASFKAACDLSDKVSCTKVMLSPYADMFFFSTFGIALVYYALMGVLAYFNLANMILIASLGSCLLSCFLAYLLIFKIKSLCILCTSLYVVNFLMLFLAYKAMYA